MNPLPLIGAIVACCGTGYIAYRFGFGTGWKRRDDIAAVERIQAAWRAADQRYNRIHQRKAAR